MPVMFSCCLIGSYRMLPLFAYSVDLNDLLLLAQQVDRTERRMLQLQKPIIYFGIALGHPKRKSGASKT
mgnify:CR=1 FL=1